MREHAPLTPTPLPTKRREWGIEKSPKSRRSLRGRLLWWYTGLLFVVVASFGGILFFRAWTGRWQEIDGQLEAGTLYLDASLRGFPPNELDGKGPGPKKGPPPGWPRDKKLAELKLPRELTHGGGEEVYFAVWRGNGMPLKMVGLPEGVGPHDVRHVPSHPVLVDREDRREAWMKGPNGSRIVVGRVVTADRLALFAFAGQLVGAGAVVLLLGAVLGWFLSARIVRPLEAISATAASMSASNLGQRLETGKVDAELAKLAGVLNSLFARLESAFERQRQFTADASHELRTPLAILRSQAELTLSRPRDPEEYRQCLETVVAAATRMTGLVEGLLTLARADAGRLDLPRLPVELDRTVQESIDLLQPLAREKEITLTAALLPVVVFGDERALGQVVNNLIDNALRHNRVGGKVEIMVKGMEGRGVLAVSDDGPGIPEEDRPRIFERFYRVDRARARTSGGTGLGLAICQAIVRGHGGRIALIHSRLGGACFEVELPLAGE